MSNFKKTFAFITLIALTSSFSFAGQKARLCKVDRVLSTSDNLETAEFGVYVLTKSLKRWSYLAYNGSFPTKEGADESVKFLVNTGYCEAIQQ